MDDSSPIIDVTPHPADYVPSDDFWAFLRRRKGAIAFFFIVGMAIALWWLISRPRLYEAESRVMIVRTGAGGSVSEAELASEIELVRDPTHLDKVASKQIPNASDAQIHDLQRKIDSALTVAPAGKSNLVAIRYEDTDPTSAARVVNQIVELYLADRRFIFQTGGRTSVETASPAAELLAAFDALNHGTQLRAELESRVKNRIELENRITELKSQIGDHRELSATLRKRKAGMPDRIHSRTRTRTGATPAAQQVEDTEILNPLKQEIESALLRTESAAAGLKARLEETFLALREARAAEGRASTLSSERDRLERKAIDTRGTGDTSDHPNLRATLINRAQPPYGPTSQHFWIWLLGAFAAALALAMFIAWIIDQFDKPIYTSDDFEHASGVPPVDHFARGAGA